MSVSFYSSNYPFCDFAFISGTSLDINKSLKGFTAIDIVRSDIKLQVIYNNYIKTDLIINDIIFSGYGIINNRWVNGMNDLSLVNVSNEKDLEKSKGTFSYAIIKNDRVCFFTDFWGNGKIFYYSKNGVTIVSNRLHLLLILLHFIGEKIELDYDIIGIYCSNLNHLFMQQPLSSDLFYKDVKILEAHEKLEMFSDGIIFTDSEFGRLIKDENCGSISVHNNEYKQLINDAKEEIISDLNTIFNSGYYDHYICDLTGGKDSRISFAALTNIDEFNKKIRINNYGDDYEKKCVATMMKAYDLKYDPVFFRSAWWDKHFGIDTTIVGIKEYFDTLTSFHLGTYWGNDTFIGHFNIKLDRALRFSGNYGEVFSRNINYYFNISDSIEETISILCQNIEKSSLINGYGNKLKNLLLSYLKSIECKNVMLGYKSIHFHRLRYHFSNTADSAKTETYSPCLSIEAFKSYCYSLKNSVFPQFYYDLLYAFNPLVACFESNSEANNIERLNNADCINCDKEEYKKISIKVIDDLTAYNEFYKSSKLSHFNKSEILGREIKANYDEWFSKSIDKMLFDEIVCMSNIIKENVPIDFYDNVIAILENTVNNNRTNVRLMISVFRRLKNIVEAIKINMAQINEFEFNTVTSLTYKYEDFVE